MGVVYHANYLLYFEDARIDFLDALDFSYAERIEGAGYMSPIHDIEIHYKAPLRYGEAGVVRTSIAKNLPMRTVYRQQVYRAEDVLEGETADGIAGDPIAEGSAVASPSCARARRRSWMRSSPCASSSATPSSP